MSKTEPVITSERKGYILAGLRDLSVSRPSGNGFELPDIAEEASTYDFDYDPRPWWEKAAAFAGVDLETPEKRRQRARAYLGEGSTAHAIMAELQSEQKVVAERIAATLLEVETYYGRLPNQDGMLYRLADTSGAALSQPVPSPEATI